MEEIYHVPERDTKADLLFSLWVLNAKLARSRERAYDEGLQEEE